MHNGLLAVYTNEARSDFLRARRAASLQHVISQITGKSIDLLPYDEITRKLRVSAGSERGLKDVPLKAIIGSVSRYSDYSRSFLPLLDSDRDRWVSIMVEITAPGRAGLPPVELYKIGDIYFVKDGHHRISVAKRLHARSIEAFVTEISSRIPLSKDVTPEELILKEEYAAFLEHTHLHEYFPEADLQLSFPGLYATLEEHINVHRYFMGIEALHEISYEDAVRHWFETIYQPIASVIHELAILHEFPGRTETDLYVWISDHRSYLQKELGWNIPADRAAVNLMREISPRRKHYLYRIGTAIINWIFPMDIFAQPKSSSWRMSKKENNHLIKDILVPIDGSKNSWYGLEQALVIASREGAQLLGLHVVGKKSNPTSPRALAIEKRFKNHCMNQGVNGHLTVLRGEVAKVVNKKALFSDMIVLNLDHPPGDSLAARLTSGILDIIRHSRRPVLATLHKVTPISRILLAYIDSLTGHEAMYLSAYMANRWGSALGVVTVSSSSDQGKAIQAPVREYCRKMKLDANYFQPTGYVSEGIIKIIHEYKADLLVIGGFNRPPMVEVVLDMTLDQLLRESPIPVLVCQ